MTTNRPFFANFLAAFRTHPVVQKSVTSTTPSAVTATATPSSYIHTSSHHSSQSNGSGQSLQSSNPRMINTKGAGATTTAVQNASQFQPTRQHAASPYSRSPCSPTKSGFPIPGTSARGRRESDSSSDGFRETLGAEKWYIGGRTAGGEERFYRLGMVKRPRSVDRLSLDRLSI